MEETILDVTQGVYASAKEARKADRIPMIYYGKDVKPVNFSVDYQDFRRIYKKAGKSTIITMVNEKKEKFPVLVQEIQYHPVTDKMIHIDLMAVNLNKTITTEVPLIFVGIAPAVKADGGILVTSKDSVIVECLPKDLIHEIEVDISSLVDFHTSIKVRDLKVPDTIKIIDSEGINIANVSAPRQEEAASTTEESITESTEGEIEKKEDNGDKIEEKKNN